MNKQKVAMVVVLVVLSGAILAVEVVVFALASTRLG